MTMKKLKAAFDALPKQGKMLVYFSALVVVLAFLGKIGVI